MLQPSKSGVCECCPTMKEAPSVATRVYQIIKNISHCYLHVCCSFTACYGPINLKFPLTLKGLYLRSVNPPGPFCSAINMSNNMLPWPRMARKQGERFGCGNPQLVVSFCFENCSVGKCLWREKGEHTCNFPLSGFKKIKRKAVFRK